MKKKLKLTPEERAIEQELLRGEWKSVPNWPKRKKELEADARAQLAKSARVNIRLAPIDLHGLKDKAVQEGMPYQTLIASVLHKYVTGQFVAR
jgi:predicted DNA binding CopG/RHH family protein